MDVVGERERWDWRAKNGYDSVAAVRAFPSLLNRSIATGAGCDYRGPFDPWRCPQGRGTQSQHLLYLPWSWLEAGTEVEDMAMGTVAVVLFEERPGGANPWLVKFQVGKAGK
jgi:hypothetical protein